MDIHKRIQSQSQPLAGLSWPSRLGYATRIFAIPLLILALLAISSASSTDEISADERQNGQARQYFKVHTLQPGGPGGFAKGQMLKQSTRKVNKRRAINGSDSDYTGSKINKQQQKQLAISNATLKKLLNQSLISKSGNLTETSGVTKSNFKFVFIQRATAAPAHNGSSSSEHAKNVSGATKAPQASLAASVSKQLASSLLSSASSIVGNTIANSSPSITALASQIVSQSVDSNRNKTTETKDEDKLDKLNSKAPESTKSTSVSRNSIGNKKTKSRPSKVYNLPVKFVANGQPTSIVFNTIRQHFATIKKLQASMNGATKTAFGDSSSSKRRKPGRGKLDKGNSRLIYLPLKYLSNAKPNRIITSKFRI